MLSWRFTIHNTLSTYVVLTGGKTCCVGGLYTIYNTLSRYVVLEVKYVVLEVKYVVLEVKHVVLEVYHSQHTLNICCADWR